MPQCIYYMSISVFASNLFSLQLQISEEGRELEDQEQKSHDVSSSEDRNKLAYLVTDVPPWYLCIFLAIQVGVAKHFLPFWMNPAAPRTNE